MKKYKVLASFGREAEEKRVVEFNTPEEIDLYREGIENMQGWDAVEFAHQKDRPLCVDYIFGKADKSTITKTFENEDEKKAYESGICDVEGWDYYSVDVPSFPLGVIVVIGSNETGVVSGYRKTDIDNPLEYEITGKDGRVNFFYQKDLPGMGKDLVATEIVEATIFENNKDVIDVQIINKHFPAGECYVLVRPDSFDEDVFDYFAEGRDKEGWIELLHVGDTPADPYCVQGMVLFFNPAEEEKLYTSDTAVKLIEDIVRLDKSDGALFDQQGEISQTFKLRR